MCCGIRLRLPDAVIAQLEQEHMHDVGPATAFAEAVAGYAAAVLLMSANRQAEKDRLAAYNDYVVGRPSGEENRAIVQHREAQDELMITLFRSLTALEDKILEPVEQQDDDPFTHLLSPCLAASSWWPPGATRAERACVTSTA
jgi:hypothetical protein